MSARQPNIASKLRKAPLSVLILSISLSAISTKSYAQDPRELGDLQYTSPSDALRSGDFEAVRLMLTPRIDSGEHAPNDLFLLGITEKQAGNHLLAIDYFQRLLAIEPNSPRVRLEMAESLYLLGRYEQAEIELIKVKETNPPLAVIQRIDTYIAAIEQKLDIWNLQISAGSFYDSNVNAGPDTDTVYIGSLPFTLNQDAQNNSDWASTLGINLGYNNSLNNKTAIRAGASLNYTDYRDMDNYDALVGSLWAGPGFNLGRTYVYLPVVASLVRLGHDESYYQKSFGISPQVGYQLDQQWSLSGRLSLQTVDYKAKTSPDSTQARLDSSIRYQASDQLTSGAGFYLGRESSDTDTRSNKRQGVRAFADYQLDENWSTNLSADYSRISYDGIQPLSGTERKDRKVHLSADLTRQLPAWNSQLSIGVNHTKQTSSISLYEYNRQVVSFTISKKF